jgi:hypothetical protein
MSKIREFIENNEVYFEEGSRNSTVITLIGYAQYLGLSKEDLEEELQEEIENDSVIQDEIDRLWGYASSNNYAKYWTTKQAKKDWSF